MKPTVGIVAQGTMGAGLAHQLTRRGVTVLTDLSGRSEASRKRAAAAGMKAVSTEDLASCNILLSVLPPAEALTFARRMRDVLASAGNAVLFADCNAVSPKTVMEIEAAVRDVRAPASGPGEATGTVFADVGIIGLPPDGAGSGPHLYASGPGAGALTVLNEYGLDVRLLDAPVGAASALKMAYAGISKGVLAVTSVMILGAARAGVTDALAGELAESDARFLETISKRIPNMLPKTYRWVEEMHQIGEFLSPDDAGEKIFSGAAGLYERIARDFAGEKADSQTLLDFLLNRERRQQV